MATSATTHLADVDAAITATLNGQVSSYSIASRSLSRLPIETLFKIRATLQVEIERDAGTTNSMGLAKFGVVK